MSTTEPRAHEPLDADAKRLAEMGYKQDLSRSWSGFSNFAISFSIISILAGCFTNFGAGWNNGGPVSISWSWPILSLFILLIGFTMSELVSAYPTSGGIYWWASRLGGPRAGFYTGWLNLVGLIAVTAGVSYGCATFIDLTISTYSKSYADSYSLARVFFIFVVVLAIAAVLNIFSSHLMALMNNVSVWWHVAGAAAIVLILLFVPDHHQSFNYVFTERFNNSGFGNGSTSNFGFWFAIVPFGFLLTQYTITGFDASAHLSEETHSASSGAARGSGSPSPTRPSAATSCCCASSSRFPTPPTGTRTTPGWARAVWPTSSALPWGPTGPRWCCSSRRPASCSVPSRA
jgi:amino acid transporter